MSHSKSPYEIRSDLLHLAYTILKGQKDAECAQEATDSCRKEVYITKAPSADDIIAEAKKLNSFVSQNA